MIKINNGLLTAEIKELGAELKSLKYKGKEYIWKGDEKIWASSCPVLFPICSGLKDNKYRLNGKTYELLKHGFARRKEFSVYKKSENSVTFLLTDDEETFKQYPFHFEFYVIYTLKEKSLKVDYKVKNNSDTDMYFSVGAHEGYSCPEGIDKYSVFFECEEHLINTVPTGPNTLGYEEVEILKNGDRLDLDYKYFKKDALVFLNLKSESLILKCRDNDVAVKLTFKDFPYFLLWTKPDAPFICMEPWCGISDRDDFSGDFKDKQGINRLEPNGAFERTHTIEIL